MSATSMALVMLASGRVPRKNGNEPLLWPSTMNSTLEFAGLRFVSRNVGRCEPPLYRYEAETVMSLPIARSTVNSAMLICGRSSVGDRYWMAGLTAVGGCDVNTNGYCGAPTDVGVKL